ncbi:MAG TPA: hypothetical protein VK518_04160 [Puia sp.]|nr:hypothetical protein [Puia sp.]
MLTFLFILLVLSGISAFVSFCLYLKTRIVERDHPDEQNPDLRRSAALDRQEKTYQRLHFISLLLFVILGVVILVLIPPHPTTPGIIVCFG